ncbi:luc7-like protein 3 [Drosophila miranda]|uniref:GA16595 n=1 Tax=Drosophila miranda TaxID=7229 RepID=D0QWF5_DROMI|nr:luc7-like protein 3 [Drosophila miranda]ACN94663.1 GA16595 [Drosophila miranda]
MVDAARQMLDELMGRNRNLHPSEAGLKVNWEDPEFCQFYNVKFCPHDLFINTRADLGPCARIHDEEAKHLYEEARPARKRQYEDEFLRFCNVMLHDVDRKIQKGKQRLQLMQRDHPPPTLQLSKHQDQLNTLNARINKLLAEAEEAGIRGDVDQAQDLMTLCEEVKEEKEQLLQQYDASRKASSKMIAPDPSSADDPIHSPRTSFCDVPVIHDSTQAPTPTRTINPAPIDLAGEAAVVAPAAASPTEVDLETTGCKAGPGSGADGEEKSDNTDNKSQSNWSHEALPEKQMKVCEICGAFLIVGDAQQRIEDHLMGKQHLGYSKVRNAVAEINDERQKERDQEREQEREQEERRRREGRGQRFNSYDNRREPREYRERSRDYVQSRQTSDRRHHHHKSHHGHTYSRNGSNSNNNNRSRQHNHSHSHYRQESRERHARSRSRSRY